MQNPEILLKPPSGSRKKSKTREYAEALLSAVLIALFVRAFVVEAFKIPSKSMVPTLMVGDHIFVNKFVYGIRIPILGKWIAHFRNPERGEVVVFVYPKNESLDFIKRVVGLPGDKISVQGLDLFINGNKVEAQNLEIEGRNPQDSRELLVKKPVHLSALFATLPFFQDWQSYKFYDEKLGNIHHWMQHSIYPRMDQLEITIPPEHFFVMGDNRENSSDSREWGFVPMKNLKGRAMFIWLSLDHDQGGVRWDRFGKWIQ